VTMGYGSRYNPMGSRMTAVHSISRTARRKLINDTLISRRETRHDKNTLVRQRRRDQQVVNPMETVA